MGEGEDEGMEELRRRRLAEKQKSAEAKAAEQQLKEALRAALDVPAYERISNVAMANRELYVMAAQQVLMAAKRLGRPLTEGELLTVLRALKSRTEKETSITFERK